MVLPVIVVGVFLPLVRAFQLSFSFSFWYSLSFGDTICLCFYLYGDCNRYIKYILDKKLDFFCILKVLKILRLIQIM